VQNDLPSYSIFHGWVEQGGCNTGVFPALNLKTDIMASVNSITLLGRVGKDPETRQLNGGKKVCNLTVATSETFKDKDGNKKEATQWHQVTAWGATADIIEKYVHKGDQLYVQGQLIYEQWEDKDGVKHTTAKIRAGQVVLLGSKKPDNMSQPTNEAISEPTNNETGDDLPFIITILLAVGTLLPFMI
jgi:single-strand DNA-binding protein